MSDHALATPSARRDRDCHGHLTECLSPGEMVIVCSIAHIGLCTPKKSATEYHGRLFRAIITFHRMPCIPCLTAGTKIYQCGQYGSIQGIRLIEFARECTRLVACWLRSAQYAHAKDMKLRRFGGTCMQQSMRPDICPCMYIYAQWRLSICCCCCCTHVSCCCQARVAYAGL